MVVVAMYASGCGDSGLPDATVIRAGGVDDPASIEAILHTVRGHTVVFHGSPTGRAATIWDGFRWSRHQIYSSPTLSSTAEGVLLPIPTFAVAQLEGRPAVIAVTRPLDPRQVPRLALRVWSQRANGDFSYDGPLASDPGGTYSASRTTYFGRDGVTLAAGSGLGGLYLIVYEHVDGGGWSSKLVSQARAPYGTYAAGVGRLSDGTSIVASMGDGLWLHRRVEGEWAPYRKLANGGIDYANIEFPPETATARAAAVAVYTDPLDAHPRGLLVSVTDGTPGDVVELLPMGIGLLDAQIVFATGGERGEILLWDKAQHLAYLVHFTSSGLGSAQELRPDLVFDAPPRLVYHPVGGFMILHVSRMPSEASRQQPARLVSLDEFAGL